MKYLNEYRAPEAVESCLAGLKKTLTRNWNIMEVCGGQTHAIFKFGLDRLLPDKIKLLHGPGCPVCITPAEMIDKALYLALRPNNIFCSFGDMIRVPGHNGDLMTARSQGGDVRVVYSPLDAVALARNNPDKEVIFFAIGFETTAPVNAAAVMAAEKSDLRNFSILNSMVRIPPAIEAVLDDPECRINAFLAPGHVCTISGFKEYDSLSDTYKIPFIITGFEPIDLAQGILMAARQLEQGLYRVENQYNRAVVRDGNINALAILKETFEVCDRQWRGLGEIARSGYKLKDKYRGFDAEIKFSIPAMAAGDPDSCIASQILRGLKKPEQCRAFGTECTPEHPLGPMMVSSEGACAAYYHYRHNQI